MVRHMSDYATYQELTAQPSSSFTRERDLPTASIARPRRVGPDKVISGSP